jgi:hypothetical protein
MSAAKHTQGPDYAANLALFLVEKTGSCLGEWYGRGMPAAQQRALFGRFLGKGRIYIDGARELLQHSRKVCFGLDHDINHALAWRDL